MIASLMDKYLGCLVGLGIGDAVGELAQHGFPVDLVSLPDTLRYTDDTAMAIGLANALLSTDELTTEILGDHFLEIINKEPDRGYGGTPLVYYTAELRGISYLEARDIVDLACRNGQGSFGDGAAMRVAPAALFYRGRSDFEVKVDLISRIDHNHDLAVDAALVTAIAVQRALDDDTDALLGYLVDRSRHPEMRDKLMLAAQLLKNQVLARDASQILGNIGRSTTRSDSVVSYAIFCFLKNRNSFLGCLNDVCASTGDIDTIGAIACAIGGAFWGQSGIPEELVRRLENLVTIAGLAAGIYHEVARRSAK